MTNILEDIVRAKAKSLDEQKKRKPLRDLEKAAASAPNAPSFVRSVTVKDELSIVAEMKRQSPSAGNLSGNFDYDPQSIASVYEKSGARGLSVLTEEDYFKGSAADLTRAKSVSKLPVLRKDFFIDPYQIFESKTLGASAILLIVACLEEKRFAELHRLANDLGLDAVVEVHSKEELDAALSLAPRCIGINNRDLKTLRTDVQITYELFDYIPKDCTVISESGISDPETIREFKTLGVQAALIGESILKSSDRGQKLSELVKAGKN